MSQSGACFYIKDVASGPGTTYGKVSTTPTCTGTQALTSAASASW
jgi:hypothetical protein